MIKTIENFPKEGVVFRHIGPLLENPVEFNKAMDELVAQLANTRIDKIAGMESRGFIVATALSMKMQKPWFMVRKAGKLPKPVISMEYDLEYNTGVTLEIEVGAVKPGEYVLLVDDSIASGGTMQAVARLVQASEGHVVGGGFLLGLDGLNTKFHFKCSTVWDYSGTSANKTNPLPRAKIWPAISPFSNKSTHYLMWHPSLECIAEEMKERSYFAYGGVNWNSFPDGMPDITFPPPEALKGKHVVFLMNLSDERLFLRQLCLALVQPRQEIASLQIIIPYLGPATHERVDFPGQLATVEPVMKIISNSIPATVPVTIMVVDIHATTTRFYSTDNVTVKLVSAMPNILGTIAFPDQGAYKRFKHQFPHNPTIVFKKERTEDGGRIMTVDHYDNWPESHQLLEIDFRKAEATVIDDLIHSGRTLVECGQALKAMGFKKIHARATHAICSNQAYKNLTKEEGLFDTITVTDSNPSTARELKLIGQPFKVDSIAPTILNNLWPKAEWTYKSVRRVFVASTNEQKIEAVQRAFPDDVIYPVDGIPTGVPEQPIGEREMNMGSKNRLDGLIAATAGNVTATDVLLSIESGLVFDERETRYEDKASVFCWYKGEVRGVTSYGHSILDPEGKFMKEVMDKKQTVTYGSVVERCMGYPKGHWHEYSQWDRGVAGNTRVDQLRGALGLVAATIKHLDGKQ